MKRGMLAALALVAGVMGAQGAAAQERLVSAVEPESVRALFETWGYRPTAMEGVGDQPLFQATIDDLQNVIVFGGCSAGRDCTHIVLLVTYNDVPAAPYEWLNRQNFDYNLVTAMRREDGLLTLRTGIMMGRAGVPVSVVRAALDDWIAANNEIASRAVEAGLARE
ncbi:MAG TPA: YbjN domain-containing protein [Allosphingosinicella sp.]|nr:YbjN domain-containing protein [Allosphingosinicella sp.]